ncbi:MAG: hypothetical protein II655_13710 [Thermoguttaceae bacterium]|nr:hypothetical protein [Thermoguttaceae bacterium]
MDVSFYANRKRLSKRLVNGGLALVLIALCAFSFDGPAFGQPPGGRRPGMQDNRSGGNRPGGDRGSNRDARGGQDRRNAPNAQSERQPREGDAANGRGGERGGNRGEGRTVSFDDAIKAASPTTPIQLNQRDFVMNGIGGVYYKGRANESTPVVVLLNDLNGKPEDFNALAQQLASQGFGVLIPNLRGPAFPAPNGGGDQNAQRQDGQNPQQPAPNQEQPNLENQDPDAMPNQGGQEEMMGPGNMGFFDVSSSVVAQFPQGGFPQGGFPQGGFPQGGQNGRGGPNAMPNVDKLIYQDYQAWFGMFLKYLHNNKYCNMRKTVLVGSGFGAALAAAWAMNDWNSKDEVKQNIVGIALLSPDASDDAGKYNALNSLESVHKRIKGATMGYLVFVGKMNEEKFKDAKTIQQKVGGKVADESTPMEDRSCPLVAIQTEKQGNDLLVFESFGVTNTICQWVNIRMKKLPKKRDKWEEIAEKKSRRD